MPMLFRAGHHEFALQNSLQSAELRRDLLQPAGRAAKHDDLEAQIMRQVGVHRGDDQLGVVVLQLRKMIAELRSVVVIDQRERARRVLAIGRPCLKGQPLADKLPDRLASGSELACLAIAVELIEQVVFQRNGKTNDIGHDGSAVKNGGKIPN
jgi:hypothetical protein